MQRVLDFFARLIGLVVILLALVPFFGPPLYVEVAGREASATVVGKREEISFVTDTWTRRLFVDVRFRSAGADETEDAQVAVGTDRYDQIHVGDTTRVRYVPNDLLRRLRPLPVVRLAAQPPFGSFVALIGNMFLALLAGIGIWLLLLWAWSKSRSGLLAAAIFIYMLLGIGYLATAWPLPAPNGPLLEGRAEVGDSKEVTRIWEGRRSRGEDAVQPYTMVELSFVPQGRSDPVVAVDTIDSGSVVAIERGADVSIRYSAVDPRWAQIDGATRTYYWKNLRSFGIIAALVGVLVLFGWLFRRRTTRRASARVS